MFRPILILACVPILIAQTGATETAAIRKMMTDSADAWNRGDLPAFASFYEDAPETTFVGREVVRGGVQAILGRYRKAYATLAAMGTLAFSELEVRPLAADLALVTGRYDLNRTAAGGGPAWGRYSLILRRTAGGWKIIHDHTSSY